MLLVYLSVIELKSDKDKFEQIYTQYEQLMFAVANKVLKDPYAAEDAVHQAFLKIIENLQKIHTINCPETKSYLVIIVKNCAINIYRERQKHDMLSYDELADYQDQDSTISKDYEQKEEYSKLVHLILDLPARDKEILLLRYDNECSTQDIAQLLDIPADTVRKRLQRAKERLSKQLNESEDIIDDPNRTVRR